MKRFLFVLCALAVVPAADAFTVQGHIEGGEGLALRHCIGVPLTFDTLYIAIPIPFVNNYIFSDMAEGEYVLFAFQDLNTNLMPDVDEPRGFYGGDFPEPLIVDQDLDGIDITIEPPNTGGFSGEISYGGEQTGWTGVVVHDNPEFAEFPRGAGILLNDSGSGEYFALVDTLGVFYAYAFMDVNANFAFDAGEPRGVYGGETPLPIVVETGSFPDTVNIVMADTPSSVIEDPQVTPEIYWLGNIYPNPFNSTARVPFGLVRPAEVELRACNILGRQVSVVAAGLYPAGTHEVIFSADSLPTGFYLVELRANGMVRARRAAVLIR